MATIVNNPTPPASQPSQTPPNDGGTGTGMVVGILVVIVVILIILFFGWPALRGGSQSGSNPAPAKDQSGGTTIQVPDKMDINVNKDK